MMHRFTEDASRIFLACGPTDFRKQIPGLIATISLQFNIDGQLLLFKTVQGLVEALELSKEKITVSTHKRNTT